MADPWSPGLMEASAAFAPVRDPFERLKGETAWPRVESYAGFTIDSEARTVLGPNFDFVPSPPRPRRRRGAPVAEERYDARIVNEGIVPTRPKVLHDLFNATVWGAFPRSKRALHRRQFVAVSTRDPVALAEGRRSREEDQLALFDEGGVVVACDETALSALAPLARSGQSLVPFIQEGRARPYVFGHALLEHLAKGHGRASRAAVLVVVIDDLSNRSAIDTLLADRIRAMTICDGRAPEVSGLFDPLVPA